MNLPPWHVLLPVMFGIGITVYVISELYPGIGWAYMFILILGMTLFYKNFSPEFLAMFGPQGGPINPNPRY